MNGKLRDSILNLGLKLKTAESFTGGLVAALVTRYQGASRFFDEGLVCYSADSKQNRLGIDPKIIDRYGAVSLACITQMLKSLSSENTLVIATTGNAGPTAQCGPRGVCYVGALVNYNQTIYINVKKFYFPGTRQQVISLGARNAMKCAEEVVKEIKK